MNFNSPKLLALHIMGMQHTGSLKRDPEENKKSGYPLSQQETFSLARAVEKRVVKTKHHVQNKVTML